MPYRRDNRELLRAAGRGARPSWDGRVWTASRSSMSAVVAALLAVYRCVEVVTDGGVGNRCDTRCREATGDDCVCSCAGQQHGAANLGPLEEVVGETTIIDRTVVRWRRVVCRGQRQG